MKRLMAVVGLVLIIGCQAPPAEMTEAEIAEIESIVRAQAEALVTTQNAMDAEGFLAYFSRENLE